MTEPGRSTRRGERVHIRVVSPSFPSLAYATSRLERALAASDRLGLTVTFGEHSFAVSSDGMTAGSPKSRAADLADAFADPDVDVVMSAMAGAHSHELLEHLEAGSFDQTKPFFGHSDNGVLNAFLLSRCGIPSFYAVGFLNQLGEAGEPYLSFRSAFARAVRGTSLTFRPAERRTSEYYNWMDPQIEGTIRQLDLPGGWHWIRSGEATGRLVGSDLETLLLSRQLGVWTQTDHDILYWDISPTALRERGLRVVFERSLELLDWSRPLAVVVGPNPFLDPVEWADRVETVLLPHVSDTAVVVVNADVGHLDPVWPVPYGAHAVLSSDRDCLEVPCPAVAWQGRLIEGTHACH